MTAVAPRPRPRSAAQIAALRSGFNGQAGGTSSVQGEWQGYLSTLDWTTYPRALGNGLQIFARYVSFPDM